MSAHLAPPRTPPPKIKSPLAANRAGREEERRRGEYTLEERQAQAQHIAELMTAAAERGDREAHDRHWQALRKLVLTRPAAEVHAMEAAMGLLQDGQT